MVIWMQSKLLRAMKGYYACSRREAATKKSLGIWTSAHHRQTAFAHVISKGWNHTGSEARETGHRDVCKGADGIMQPRDQLTQKEIQVATLVWKGLTNREIAKVIGTSEQVVKNYLRTTFDKLG